MPAVAEAVEGERVDLACVRASVAAAAHVGVTQIVYVSVAQPAPVMQAYQTVRADGEQAIRLAGLTATVLRPWYVLGPGHRWPMALILLYALASLVPALGRFGSWMCPEFALPEPFAE